MRIKYDSFNRISIEKDRPQLVLTNAKLYKDSATRYLFFISLTNVGKRTATNFSGKTFIFFNKNNILSEIMNVTITINKSVILIPNFYMNAIAPCIFELPEDKLNTDVYIRGSYNDIITNKSYSYKSLYSFTIPAGVTVKADSIPLLICRQWELDKIESFLSSQPK